jgi:hypothetical protein
MLASLTIAWSLMALCVAVHAAGMAFAIRWARRQVARVVLPWHSTQLFIRLMAWIVFLHVLEIAAWAVAYTLIGAMPDLYSAFYFSAVTYTTTGYGDLLLPVPWRFVGAIEALTGILLCGWSAGVFIAVVSRMVDPHTQRAGQQHEPAHR